VKATSIRFILFMQNSSRHDSLSVSYSSLSYAFRDVTMQKYQTRVFAGTLGVLDRSIIPHY